MIMFTEKINDDKYFVRSIVYDESILSAEIKAKGIEIDFIPEPEPLENQTYDIYYNPITHEVYYEYFEINEGDK